VRLTYDAHLLRVHLVSLGCVCNLILCSNPQLGR